ncbi:hypothetical protein [Clostridium sp. DMHC 10]|uniref:hypothetical protein n=1 Tax=Clostridium sp. DMHC 10 TaxID=747377 RepID=UPI000B039E1F|nr:hypothetical protein [Clostridium sp. DMHC 10]
MKVKKYIRRIILILMLLVFITISCIGIYIGSMVYNQVCEIKFNKSNSVSYNNFKSTFDYERFNLLDKSDVTIQSNFGYKLSGTYIRNFCKNQKHYYNCTWYNRKQMGINEVCRHVHRLRV